MHALEAEIDQSGQGLFGWIDTAAVTAIAAQMLPPAQQAILQLSGALQMRSLALGSGVSDGKGRTQLIVDMPKVGFRSFLPSVSSTLAVHTAGEPGSVIVFGLPGAADLKAFEQSLALTAPQALAQFYTFKEEMRQAIGFSLEDLLETVGPELLVISDAAGSYSALHLRDPARFEEMLSVLQQRHGFRLETREIQGNTYTHLILPDFLDDFSTAINADPMEKMMEKIMSRTMFSIPSHLYWKAEDNYLLLAGIPQVLLDRDYIGRKVLLSDWLRATQKFDAGDALLGLSLQAQAVPKLFYSWHLQMLQMLGDVAAQPVDMFDLPSALELDIPVSGSYSLKLASSDSRLALEFAYESNPFELLFTTNGMTMVAIAGIAAAIAIPAYQDYTLRVKVSEGLALAAPFKLAITEFYAENSRFPDQNELAELSGSINLASDILSDISIDPASGTLTLSYSEATLGESAQLYLTPVIDAGQLGWQCSADIFERYLPADCR
jgi:hypothetical protein